jgi:hypothetical protein
LSRLSDSLFGNSDNERRVIARADGSRIDQIGPDWTRLREAYRKAINEKWINTSDMAVHMDDISQVYPHWPHSIHHH